MMKKTFQYLHNQIYAIASPKMGKKMGKKIKKAFHSSQA